MTAAVLALDVGTTWVRAVVTGPDGRALPGASVRRPSALVTAADGRAELDAEHMLAALIACVDDLSDAGYLDGVELVATSCLWHTLLGVDPNGDPVTPVLTWSDSRAASLLPDVVPSARTPGRPPADLHRRTGAPLHPLYWTVKLPWLRARAPNAHRFVGLPEFLGARLLGDDAASVSVLSGTGLLDLARCDWDDEALAVAARSSTPTAPGGNPEALRRLLPPVAPRGWSGQLLPSWRHRWPQLTRAVWTPFVGDGAAANAGAGCMDTGRMAVTVGTSAAVRVVGGDADAALDRRLWRYRVDHDRVVTGLALSGGGNLYAWARRVLTLPPEDELELALAALRPGAVGPVALPYQAGSRPPLILPAGSGVLAGLSLSTGPVELLAALLESVCLGLADGDDALTAGLAASTTARPVAPSRVSDRAVPVATGGALLASPWLQRRLAAAFGRPVHLPGDRELSAEGAAVLALGLPARPLPGRRVTADPDTTTALRAARHTRDRLTGALGWHSPDS